ncbi:hypothetical protein WICPIJ_004984 [Wickerhamomyces pijperi]|uniref:Copper-fist domain-containing protein n=1 Tax=Wickerhamomyces pijperi TaxID=599730 RepID=A0A9P8TM92_WICPI|nr:hypothetical protein WICPIJ_004984 [Wickerhamomyces pijperi]
MIYSNEFRMACLDCLSSHRHSSCIHINKVSDAQVYIINDVGGQFTSISKKILRSTYPAQHALIRVKEYKQVFQNDDRCPFDPEFNVLLCPRRRCANCAGIKKCITNVFVDSSSVVLEHQERDTVDERALQKITAWRQSTSIDNEGKSIAENMPVSAHLMSIYHLRYLDFIGFFSKTNEGLIDLTDILRDNEEVYSGGEILEHRSLLFHSTDIQGQALWKAKDILRSCVEESHSISKPVPNHPDPFAHHQRSIESQQDDVLFSLSVHDPTQIEMDFNVQELSTETDSNYEDVMLEFYRTYVSDDDEIMYELLSLLGDHRDLSLNEIQDASHEDCARNSRSDSFAAGSDYFETPMAQREAIGVQERNFRRLFGVEEL